VEFAVEVGEWESVEEAEHVVKTAVKAAVQDSVDDGENAAKTSVMAVVGAFVLPALLALAPVLQLVPTPF
jgi:hypothetical protein